MLCWNMPADLAVTLLAMSPALRGLGLSGLRGLRDHGALLSLDLVISNKYTPTEAGYLGPVAMNDDILDYP